MRLIGNASGGCVRGKINSLDVLTVSDYGIAVKIKNGKNWTITVRKELRNDAEGNEKEGFDADRGAGS